ncbi:hypothetical protein FQA47_018449 [Oryzias melastigma]|uniref:Uncharacterized protein n=1 Tax=Oryzias melastigma TaxID=30732 RepID=A0A834C383_ORYME|nr:hypothetical protein FQA47_018449 [Oryzias melastigma]
MLLCSRSSLESCRKPHAAVCASRREARPPSVLVLVVINNNKNKQEPLSGSARPGPLGSLEPGSLTYGRHLLNILPPYAPAHGSSAPAEQDQLEPPGLAWSSGSMAAAVLERASARGRRVAESCEFGPVLTGQKNRLRFGLVRSSMVHFYTSGTEHDPSPCRKSPPRGSRPSARFLWIRCYARALARARTVKRRAAHSRSVVHEYDRTGAGTGPARRKESGWG